jgi:Protein of unknown function (DUF1524)
MQIKKPMWLLLTLVATLTATFGCAEPAQARGLADAVKGLPVASEVRDGYERGLFPHWFDDDNDSCDTRSEVLIAEATQPARVSGVCKIDHGTWLSYYDEREVDDSSDLDIDHMVPLAEAWDSGAYAWSTDRRRAYANDIGDERSLAAVTASANRSKGDQDPATWMPTSDAARCRYVTEWTVVKTRWSLSVDEAEKVALLTYAAGCDDMFPPVAVVA